MNSLGGKEEPGNVTSPKRLKCWGVTNHWTTNHWTGILKFVFMLRGMQLKGNHIRV